MLIASDVVWNRTFAATKTRLKGANTGHKLLKKKSDALTVRIRQILKQVRWVPGSVSRCSVCAGCSVHQAHIWQSAHILHGVCWLMQTLLGFYSRPEYKFLI